MCQPGPNHEAARLGPVQNQFMIFRTVAPNWTGLS